MTPRIEQSKWHQEPTSGPESHVHERGREAANSRLNGRHACSGCRYMSPPPSIYTPRTMHVRVNLDATETKEFPAVFGCLRRYPHSNA